MTTSINFAKIAFHLKGQLKWRNDFQRSATNGEYLLLETNANGNAHYQLFDGAEKIVLDFDADHFNSDESNPNQDDAMGLRFDGFSIK